jgi:Co/Zn/Cd efflux system component
MNIQDPKMPSGDHSHIFLGASHAQNERRTWAAISLTLVMMVAEIAGATFYGSLAVVADGFHMATHVLALLVAALAYTYARGTPTIPALFSAPESSAISPDFRAPSSLR